MLLYKSVSYRLFLCNLVNESRTVSFAIYKLSIIVTIETEIGHSSNFEYVFEFDKCLIIIAYISLKLL